MKKILSKIISLAMACLLSSCFTHELWKDDSTTITKTSSDTIRQFLMTQDGNNIIIIGQKYHYIFSTNEVLKDVLSWQYKGDLEPNFGNFAIHSDGSTINGSYELKMSANYLNPQKQQWLIDHKFVPSGTAGDFIYKDTIQGKRYFANKQISLPSEFKKPYTITFTEQQKSNNVASSVFKVAATPLAVTADGITVALAAVPVATVILLFNIYN